MRGERLWTDESVGKTNDQYNNVTRDVTDAPKTIRKVGPRRIIYPRMSPLRLIPRVYSAIRTASSLPDNSSEGTGLIKVFARLITMYLCPLSFNMGRIGTLRDSPSEI